MEKQFEKLGAVIRSFKLEAIAARDASTFSDGDALLLSKLFELETEINIAKSEGLVLKTLCALGLENPPTDDQDDSTSSVDSLVRYNNILEIQTLLKLPTRAASEAWAFKLCTEGSSIFEEELEGTKSAEHFDKISKLVQLLGNSFHQLRELSETQQELNLRKLEINQRLMEEKHHFCEELDSQRIELEEKQNIDKDAKMELVEKINLKLQKTNTTRMLTSVLLTISDIDFNEKRPYVKLLKMCRNPVTMEGL